MGSPLKVPSCREREDLVIIGRRAKIADVSIVTDSPVPGGDATANILGGIRRRVVGNDDLDVSKRLTKQGFQGLSEIALTVVDWYPDADCWHG